MDVLFGNMLTADASADIPPNEVIHKIELVTQEIKHYSRANVGINENPLDWWKLHQTQYPYLAEVAKKRLSVAGTSVPSERLFSAAGNLLSAKRSCIASKNVDMLLFLNKNM